jgi:hypothetical protein
MPRTWRRSLLVGAAEIADRAFGRRWLADVAQLIGDRDALGEPADPCLQHLEEALAALLRACATEAELSALGRLSLRWDIQRLLKNLRRLRQEEIRAPALRQELVAAPLIITGLPRSGSTFLHRLLTADPDTIAPECWQTVFPYPEAEAAGSDRRRARVDRQLRWFADLAPELQKVHPLDSGTPQECTEITAHVFQSLRFDTTYHVPSYARWLAARGHLAAYHFHRRFLQHLQHQDWREQGRRRRWVLKSPDHVFALTALRAVYPDARVVFLHRDPLHVLASVAHLTEVLRAPFTRRIDRAGIGRQVTDDWARGADILVRDLRHPHFPAAQVLHLQYEDVARRPVETAQRLYRHFGLTLSEQARAGMARLVATTPRGGYGENHYEHAAHGIDPDEVRERFGEYRRVFGMEPEGLRFAAGAG